MSFLETIFESLARARDTVVFQELRSGEALAVTGGQLLDQVRQAQGYLRKRNLQRGDRCGLLSGNSVRWIALDLAMMAEGLIVVPLYARQAPAELVAMLKDCSPAAIFCGDAGLRDGITQAWPEAPRQFLFDEIFAEKTSVSPGGPLSADDAVTIIYTSGTSGDAKGVVLSAENIGHMLRCTSGRLDLLMAGRAGQDRVFHYLPFGFAGSWILLLTSLMRGSLLTMNSDLSKLSHEMRMAAPDYFLNVPALLERMRKAVDEQLWQAGGFPQQVYSRAKGAWMRELEKCATLGDRFWLGLARAIIFPAIRKKMIGPRLKALICGSAPLGVETQLYFAMLGIPVLQVYGLTETTAICTMDHPQAAQPGRVGPAIEGVEMELGENEEILVRGPNIFSGYWKRPEETARVLHDGWFHTGDQGEADAAGNWRIIGRIKNLIILGSGHNVAPEPIEDKLLEQLPGAQQVVLTGNGRGYLAAIITGGVTAEQVQAALDAVNPTLPHYKQVRGFGIRAEAFSIENGMLTANGKLKRDAITARLKDEIEQMYAASGARR